MSNSLDPDQACWFVRPDPGLICLHGLSTGKEIICCQKVVN